MRTFSSLKIYNFACFFVAGLVSNIGSWMARIAQGWLVLTILTHDSATSLGIVTSLQFLPLPLFSPFTGAVADRFSKRKILAVTGALFLLVNTVLAWLILTNQCQLWQVYLLAFIQGVVASVDNPARGAFVSEMVPEDQLTNAVALNSVTFNAARLIGPAAAGWAIAWIGVGQVFALNAASYIATLIGLAIMRKGELHPAPRRKGQGAIREGIAYVKDRPGIMMIMFIAFMLGTFGMNFQLTNVLIARHTFGLGAEAYGLLGSTMAIGTLVASFVVARRSDPTLARILKQLALFTAWMLVMAFSPWFWLYAILIIPVGYYSISILVSCNTSVQLRTEPQFRGRVLALYMAIFLGGTPIGAPFIGWIGDVFGARATVIVGGLATGLAVLICWGAFRYFKPKPPEPDDDVIPDPGLTNEPR